MIVANRSLKVRRGQGDVDVAVSVFMPESNGDAWTTKYEIGWPEGTREGVAAGIDSVQSLLFALQKIDADLYTSDYHKSGTLMWSDPGAGYGFPVPQNLRAMLQGNDVRFL